MTQQASIPPPDEARRVRLGASGNAAPEALRVLAADASVTVRSALAQNPAAPPEANIALARDPDERVRAVLARKLAALVPSLTREAQARLQRQTYDTLAALVQDEAVRVRMAIVDVLQEMPEAPRALILQLARDQSILVSGPIIRLSPLLSSDDLSDLVIAASSPAVLTAIAERPGIDARVSDAVAASADNAAIQALLANHTAQIREATLDTLIERAIFHVEWHAPLVRRPMLPPRATQVLAEIVATELLRELAARDDVTPELHEALRTRLAERLEAPAQDAERRDATPDEALAEARGLAAAGRLTEQTILEASRRGDAMLAGAVLAIAADLPLAVVDRAASLRSTKGLISLAWKAGFTMRTAVALQGLLGRLSPDAILPPAADGNFPLSIDEMRWQVEFLAHTVR